MKNEHSSELRSHGYSMEYVSAAVEADAWKVTLDRPQEIRFWTRRLEATEQELRAAVAAVGPEAPQVVRYILKRREVQQVRARPRRKRNR